MKYLFVCLLTGLVVTSSAQTRTQYKIGDSAFCGIVFHVEALDTFGSQRVLVCSLKDQAASIPWYNGQFVTTSAVNDVLFDRANAEQVISVQDTGNYAASVCKFFSLHINDSSCLIRDTLWYLPSLAELKLMYQNLDSTGKLNFANEGYWSSVEFTDSITPARASKKAWIEDFFNGKSLPVNKSNKYHVRAIRAFNN